MTGGVSGATIIDINAFKIKRREETGLLVEPQAEGPQVAGKTVEKSGGEGRDWSDVPVENLYDRQGNPRIFKALDLIDEAHVRVAAASSSVATDPLVADDHMMHVQATLFRLLSLRDIGEGFATVVAALLRGVESGAGGPFAKEQIGAVFQCLNRLRAEPFLSLDGALDEVDALEDAGLATTSTDLIDLAHAIADSRSG